MSSSSAATDVVCEALDVSHEFLLPNGKPFRALEKVSIAVRRDEVVALLGPSGCGKSTVLRILAGLIVPTQGEVVYHGEPLRGLNPGVAMVFQSFALFPWMTVTQNIEVVLKAANAPASEIRGRALDAIQSVGLSGFEGAYPRELSGGMKQRVGIARAVSLNPEILFMDEPFSQVDALTAESLRAEVIDIWSDKSRNPRSILMVSHDIKEVVYMADRIVLLGANPGRVQTVVENTLPRPRDYRDPGFLRLVDRLHEIITGHAMPDVAPSDDVAVETRTIEPIPATSTSEIVGLLEFLSGRGGTHPIFGIASETKTEFGQVMAIVKAAELLDFVETPGQGVVLTEKGRRFVEGTQESRKTLWREQLLRLRLFLETRDLIERQSGKEIDERVVHELLIHHLPQEHHERLFHTMVRWARFGKLFTYHRASGTLSLPDARTP